MGKENPKIKMGIYKVNYLKAKKLLGLEDTDAISPDTAVGAIIDDLISRLGHHAYRKVNISELDGLLFNTTKESDITQFVLEMLNTSQSFTEGIYDSNTAEELLMNRSTSLALMSIQDENVYFLVAGRGASYIKEYAVFDFATNLLSKLFEERSEAISQSGEDHLTGDIVTSRTTTKTKRSFRQNRKLGTILKDCIVDLEKEHQEELGFTPEFPFPLITAEITSASFKLKKALTLGEYKTLLRQINKLEKSESKFIVNNLVPAKHQGTSDRELEHALIETIMADGNGSSFKVVASSAESYPWQDLYRITYREGKDKGVNFLKDENPIQSEHIIKELRNTGDFTERGLRQVLLKSNLITKLENTNTHDDKVVSSIQGITEYGGIEYYLYGGNWHFIPSEHDKILNEKFRDLFSKSALRTKTLRDIYKLSRKDHVKENTENAYNEKLRDNENVIVGHKALIANVELADLILKHKGVVYLIHNKQAFDGPGARDVIGQTLSAARYWQDRLHSDEKPSFLEDYYNAIDARYKKEGKAVPKTKIDFKGMFSGTSPRLCFVAGYIDGLTATSKSSYAKLLSCDAEAQLRDADCEFLVFDLN